jgi:S-DNA-T family DNA segregation ATPase FtsK/SpoIIIE
MRLLPESFQSFLLVRLSELCGVACIGSAIFIFISLFTYSPIDPTIVNYTSVSTTNIGGILGSNIAEILLQVFGLCSYAIILPLLSWAYKLLRFKGLPYFSINIFSTPIFLILLGSLLSLLNINGLDGFVSTYLTQFIQNIITFKNQNINFFLSIFFYLVLTIFFLVASMGLELREWKIIFIKNFNSILWIIKLIFNFIRKLLNNKNQTQELKSKKIEQNKWVEPKIDFDNLRNQNVQDFKNNVPEPDIIEQTEIELNDIEKYKPPLVDILSKPNHSNEHSISKDELNRNAEALQSVLSDFKIEGEIINVSPGPVVTMYELQPAPGVKASKIISLSDDIARNMSAMSARVAIIPGKNVVGIEIPNQSREAVYLSELFKKEKFISNQNNLMLAIGKDINGLPIFSNLEDMPHLLIAGTTGSGKSVGINVMIVSILFRMSPEDCKFILIDPKMLELSVYQGIPHLITPVVTDPKKAITALKWVVKEMENRYQKMSMLGVRNIGNYNTRILEAQKKSEKIYRNVPVGINPETGQPKIEKVEIEIKKMPFIVVVVDEMADLMMVAGKEIEHTIQRLSQMARAAGIHLIMATQRPSVDVITGTIKANFPTRISFQVSSKFDSRTILGNEGAEKLLGKGDMLLMTAGGRTTRIHGPFISDSEVEKIVQSLKKQGLPEFDDEILKEEDDENLVDLNNKDTDELFQESISIITKEGKASTSLLQRKLQIGYNRAARIIDQLEEQGLISQANHVGKREIFFDKIKT